MTNKRVIPSASFYFCSLYLHVVDVVPADDGVVRASVEENACRGFAAVPDLIVLDAHVVAPLRKKSSWRDTFTRHDIGEFDR